MGVCYYLSVYLYEFFSGIGEIHTQEYDIAVHWSIRIDSMGMRGTSPSSIF